MRTPWCLIRTSLFPQDFNPETAPKEDIERFHGALGFVSPGLGVDVDSDDPTYAGSDDALARYAARVRHRSGPRGLFAAAALALPEGADASLKDVVVEVSPSREVERCTSLAGAAPKQEGLFHLAPEVVIHPGGICRYRYNPGDQDYDASALHMPESLKRALIGAPGASLEDWDARFKAFGVKSAPGEDLPRVLVKLGVLRRRGRPMIHNGGEAPTVQPLRKAITLGQRVHREGIPRHIEGYPEGSIPPLNAFATFKKPVAMPEALSSIQEVAQLLARCAISAPTGVSQVLMKWLDGRWCSLAQVERYAEGIMREAAPRQARINGDNAFVDWVRNRGMEATIDLGDAPLPTPHYEGPLLVASEWTREGRLVEPFIFGMGPRELMGRYAIEGLPQRLGDFDTARPCVLAYHGPRNLGDISEIYAPGTKVLEYCGTGSDPALGLSLNQVEVTSLGAGLIFRDRDTLEPLSLKPSVPLNETLSTLHPLVRLLLGETRSGLPVVPLFKRALQDFPIRPRLTYKGHIIRRRRAAVPKDITPQGLSPWLRSIGLGGQVALEVQDGRLAFDPREDSAIRRLLFKELRAGKTPSISEFCQPSGISIDGRPHAAHALVPMMMGTPKPRPTSVGIPGPKEGETLRGPFTTLSLRALPEAMPAILRRIRGVTGPDFGGFYVNMGGNLDAELRLRVPRGEASALGGLLEMVEELLEADRLRTWSTGPYLREWDRYGGAEDISAVEAFFVADSQAFLEVSGALGLKDEARNDLYTLALLQALFMGGFEGQEALAFCREGVEAFSREYALDPGERRAIGVKWRGRKGEVMALARGEGGGIIHDVLVARRGLLKRWIEGPGSVEQLRSYIKPLIHMSGTRLHIQGNRYAEGEAHFYGAHALGEWCHRGGLAEVMAFLA